MDGALIPYDSVHGITLITLLRLGLLPALRMRAYHQFVALPLYLDMAPWNIVFRGPALDYIDFDTKDRTFDAAVAKAYQVMEVLFNYKRTLEDFKRCGPKGGNPYNFPFVSECVKAIDGAPPPPAAASAPCSDSRNPVRCADGVCRSDYVACHRALSAKERLTEGRKAMSWAVTQYAVATAGRAAGGDGSGADAPTLRGGGGGGGGGGGDAAAGGAGVAVLAREAHQLTRDFFGLGAAPVPPAQPPAVAAAAAQRTAAAREAPYVAPTLASLAYDADGLEG